jgi:hypothetical protein
LDADARTKILKTVAKELTELRVIKKSPTLKYLLMAAIQYNSIGLINIISL